VTVDSQQLAPAPAAGAVTTGGGRRDRQRLPRAKRATSLTPISGLGLGIALTWFSLLVLIPLTAVLVQASMGGWSAYWDALTSPQTLAALKLTVGQAVLVTAVNIVMGTVIAWVLVRDQFAGKQLLEVVIDIPFALPTIVAGLVLLSLYGPSSPLGVNWANTRVAVFLAFLFVTLPFIVRTVQPVLLELEQEVEEAAASLGASRLTTFRLVILPSLAPAIASGAAFVLLPRDQRVRIAGAAVGQPALLHRGGLGAHHVLHRGRPPDGGGGCRVDLARRGTDRDHHTRSDLPEGGPLCLIQLLIG